MSALDVDGRVAADLINAGDLLPDWFDDWVLLERERLRHLWLQALELLGTEFIHQHRYGLAIQAGLAAARTEPLRDSSRFVIIQAHLQQGNLSDAIREYRAYKDQLWRELRILPSRALAVLVEDLSV
jgi:DNA-binding SARP family transcriptional activator